MGSSRKPKESTLLQTLNGELDSHNVDTRLMRMLGNAGATIVGQAHPVEGGVTRNICVGRREQRRE
jgi:hypothetical protein